MYHSNTNSLSHIRAGEFSVKFFTLVVAFSSLFYLGSADILLQCQIDRRDSDFVTCLTSCPLSSYFCLTVLEHPLNNFVKGSRYFGRATCTFTEYLIPLSGSFS